MRKSKGILIAGVLLLMLSTTGCSGSTPAKVGEVTQEVQSASAVATTQQTIDPLSTDNPAAKILQVFYGDIDKEFIISKSTASPDQSEIGIVDQLVGVGVLEDSVEINKMEEKQENNQKILYLDFNKELSNQLLKAGSADERIVLGSITNTFVTAMKADGVLITVEGETLSTGYKSYVDPLTYYPACPEKRVSVVTQIDGKDQTVKLLRSYQEMGFAVNYDDSRFESSYNKEENSTTLASREKRMDGMPKAYFKVYQMTEDLSAAEQVLLGKTKNPIQESTSLGVDSVIAKKIQGKDLSGIYKEEYYLFDSQGTTWVVEMGYEKSEQNALYPILGLFRDSFEVVQ